jgi:heme exporter protein A
MLDVIDLDFDYSEQPLLQGVQFQVKPGILLHLRGNNGAGKTTLLKLLAGLLHPTQGEIRYQGRPIWDDLAQYHKAICYIGHKTGVSQLLTVREQCQLEYQTSAPRVPCEQLTKQFGLQGLEEVSCSLLSVGQRRRVGLLRILVSNTPLWLLDEPLVGLDKTAVVLLASCFQKHLTAGGQIIITSHQDIPLSGQHYQDYCL